MIIMIMKFIRKKENVRLKIQVTAYIMTVIILLTPLFNLSKGNKNVNSIFPKVSASSNGNDEKDNVRSFKELLDEVETNYDVDFSNMVIPILSNDKCDLQYAIDRTDNLAIYNEATKILNMIINNSTKYSLDNKDFVSTEINDLDDINRIDKILINDIIKTYIKELLKRGINKDICIISNLKIVLSYDKNTPSEVKIKYFNDKNTLVIYPDNIRGYAKENGSYFYEELEKELMLILNRLRQNACCHQSEGNTFYNETLKEAAVTTELYNYGYIDSIDCGDLVYYERLVLLLGLFNENTSYYDYSRSIFNNDMDLFYNFCLVKDSDDINRLAKILYCIDLDSNTLYDYRVDLFSMVINNMINYTYQNKDFKLRDNLVIYRIIYNIINQNMDYIDSKAKDGINRLNDIYFKFLSYHYKSDIDSINNMLNSDRVNLAVKALIDICSNNIDYDLDISYTNYSMELVNRFPLLRYVLSTYTLEEIDIKSRILES